MAFTKKEIKERSWAKKKESAIEVQCACGCGQLMLNVDDYGRSRKFITGHNGKKYPDGYNIKTAWVKRNRKSVNEAKSERGRRLKLKLISEYTDSMCTKCGLEYNATNGAVFQFHHRDPSTKELGIGSSLLNDAWKKIVAEVGKCDLVCANCHLIIHHGEY